MLEYPVRDLSPLGDSLRLVEGPVDAEVMRLWPFSSSACESEVKVRGFRGRVSPSFPTVTPLYSSETNVKRIASVR